MVPGRMRSATCLTREVAAPSETPGRRPNETDTDGNCPEWLMDWGPTDSLYVTTESSGTTPPELDLKATFLSESDCDWYLGSSSSITRYWLAGPSMVEAPVAPHPRA